MTRKTKISLIILSAIIALTVAGGGLSLLLDKLLHLDTYKEQIIAESQRFLNRQVLYEKGDFSFKLGPSFTFTKVVIKERNSSTNFVSADKITMKIALLPLLEKKVVLKELIFDHPHVNLNRDQSGVFNFDDLLEHKESSVSVHLKGIRINNGVIRFDDRKVSPAGLLTVLDKVDLHLNNLARGKNCSIKLAASFAGSDRGRFTVTGSMDIAGKKMDPLESEGDLKIVAYGLDAAHFWPYYMAYVPFRKPLGQLDADVALKGKLKSFKSKGEMRVAGLRFDYPQVFHAVLIPKDLHFRYAMEFDNHDVVVKSLNLSVDKLNVKGSCSILDIHGKDPRIVAQAVTSPFRLEEFGGYVPYGIIVKDTADFIEQRIKGGTYRLDEGRLNGKVSQILHMELGQNYNVLFIKGKVDQGILSFGPNVPTFNGIKGDLEMRGKDFNLIGMSGNFGTSPFTLNGKIADYPLTTPSSYPFTMKIVPREAEVKWLMGKDRAKDLSFSGNSELDMAGSGFTNGYNLSGQWNLGNAAYSFKNYIQKPAKRANRLIFKGSINKQEARLTQLSYDLSPLFLNLGAGYRYDGPMDLSIQTNQFSAAEVVSMVPFLKSYRPSGRLQAGLTGKGTGDDFSTFSWGGNVAFTGFSIKPPEPVKTVSNMSGTIRFKGDELETSQLSVKLGTSIIAGRGSLKGFKNPTLNISFSSPALNMADVGVKEPQSLVVENVRGTVSLKDQNMQIKDLSGTLKSSTLNLSGSVHDLSHPMIDISLSSPNLNLEDLMVLGKLKTSNDKASSPLKVKGTIQAASGRYKNLEFRKLKASTVVEDKILYLEDMNFSAFGGEVSARGRFDSGSIGTPHYQLGFNLKNVSAEKVTKGMGMKKQEITGTLNAQGELTAKGNSPAELKQTALGSIRLNLEEGSLRRFSTLSKIFSILNVSQLLKLQLPDMVSGGMPYNGITGTFSIRDGIIATKDLFLDGDAMNISCVGNANLAKDEIDAKVGVQPLQTVDKVVSHIPIVGWILTGKNKTLITAYFEVKGKLDDPKVSAVPVQDLAKGVFDIFKRVFQLPAKMFTETGAVFIGK